MCERCEMRRIVSKFSVQYLILLSGFPLSLPIRVYKIGGLCRWSSGIQGSAVHDFEGAAHLQGLQCGSQVMGSDQRRRNCEVACMNCSIGSVVVLYGMALWSLGLARRFSFASLLIVTSEGLPIEYRRKKGIFL